MISEFRFKKFTVLQSEDVFKIGTDGVLAGLLTQENSYKNILEIGCGTAVISMIVAQKNPNAILTAIDISSEAIEIANKSVVQSPFFNRIQVFCCDAKEFKSKNTFDYIICNPPYFNESSTQHSIHANARQQLLFTYEDWLLATKRNLAAHGTSAIIFPADDFTELETQITNHSFFIQRMVQIYGIKGGNVKRCFVEIGLEKKECTVETLYIEQSSRVYSDEYKELGKDFYVKF